MSLKLNIEIARSLLMARFRQTLVAAIGVTFSITMFVALLGFMTGLNDMLDGLILNRTAHVRLFNEIKPGAVQPIQMAERHQGNYHFIHSVKPSRERLSIYNSEAVLNTLGNDDRVAGIAPKITTQVFFNEGAIFITSAANGIDVEKEKLLFHFGDYVVAGSATDIDRVPNSIILGKALAEKLLVNTGEMVYLTTVAGERFPLKVVGLFQSGIQEYDKAVSFTSILTMQKLLGKTGNYITDIQLKLKNIERATTIAAEYARLFDTDAEDIQTVNAEFETGTFIRTLISYAVGVTLLTVAGFGIYNILNMMIYEKMDTIAILKATGFAGTDVKMIFLLIAVSIGIFGGLSGLFAGFLFSTIIDRVPFETTALPTIKTYPVNYDAAIYLVGGIFSLLTTFLAGYFPARKASNVDPVNIIRGK